MLNSKGMGLQDIKTLLAQNKSDSDIYFCCKEPG
jgi:hypothetical protein